MIICSWNIEHFRFDKVVRKDTENFKTFQKVVSKADISFFYEGKTKDTSAKLARIMNADEDSEGAWVGVAFWTLNEWVGCIYNSGSIASAKEASGPAANVASVPRLSGVIAEVSSGERMPPIVKIDAAKGDGSVIVAPWHCYGPAKQMTSAIFPRLTRKLAEVGVELFFGDFNFEGSHARKRARTDAGEGQTVKKSPRLLESIDLEEMTAEGGVRTSTQSQKGATNRSGPLDRCMRAKQFAARLFQLDPVDIPSHLLLTNHSPLFIFTGDDMTDDVINKALDGIKTYKSPANLSGRKFVRAVRHPKK